MALSADAFRPGVRTPWWWPGRGGMVAAAIVGAALVAVVFATAARPPARPGVQGRTLVIADVLDDHLRLASGRQRLGVESERLDQVTPWLASQLDFAPALAFAGDADLPLRGASIGGVRGRRAAVVVYGRRGPATSLHVFRAEGLPWPADRAQRVGSVDAIVQASRGVSIALWRAGDVGYALVSDVGAAELPSLIAKVVGPAS